MEFQQIPGASPMDAQELNQLMQAQGYSVRRLSTTPQQERRITEAARLFCDAMTGKCEAHLFRAAFSPRTRGEMLDLQESYPALLEGGHIGLRETMSYSDYSILTVDILDRLLYGQWDASTMETAVLVKKQTLRDFRMVARYVRDGARKPWSRVYNDTTLPPTNTPPGEPPTQRALVQTALGVAGSTNRVTYQPFAYQAGMSVDWEALINDDLGFFKDMVNDLVTGGQRTIMSFITSLYMTASGWSTTMFNSTFRNLITPTYGAASTNPPFSAEGVQDGLTVLENQLDYDGQPINFQGTLYLVHGPSLTASVRNYLNTKEMDLSVRGGTQNTQGFPQARIRVGNWAGALLTPVQDKYMRLVCTDSTIKETAWALVYSPESQPRPTAELGQLRGYETPQIFQKLPNTMRVGGGVDQSLGDFETLTQQYKGVMVFGGSVIDGRSAVASSGKGS